MAADMKLDAPRATVRRAKYLRATLTTPEVLLWQHLRGAPDGVRFRRQHPIGPYILDFFCHEASLAIEVDGIAHDMGNNPVRDERRGAWLADRGIATLRLTAREVLTDVDRAASSIVATARARSPLHQASPGPPPPMGEELQEPSWTT